MGCRGGWLRKPVGGLLLLSVLFLWSPEAKSQLPGVEAPASEGAAPAITIGGIKSPAQKVADIRDDLETREKESLSVQGAVLSWRDELAGQQALLTELRTRRAAAKQESSVEGAVTDPALLLHLDLAIAVATDHVETLTLLLETVRREQEEIAASLRLARQVLEKLQTTEAPAEETSGTRERVLDEVLHYLSELSRLRVSLSLLKAQRAGLNEELDQKVKEKRAAHELPDLEEFTGPANLRAETLRLRDEVVVQIGTLKALRKTASQHTVRLTESQLQHIRIEIIELEEELAREESRRLEIFDSLVVREDDLKAGAERLERETARIAEEGREIQRTLKTLRMSPPTEPDVGTFTARKAWEVQVSVLQHRLYLLDLELQLETLKTSAIRALYPLVRLQSPPASFFQDFEKYLDADRQDKAREELRTRGEAWRKEYSQISLEEPTSQEAATAETIRKGYREVLDLYDRMDSRKWEMEWCAEVVRYYNDLFQSTQRDFLWYSWRSVVTLLAFLLGVLASIFLGRVTIRPIRRREELGDWARYGLFLGYLSGFVGLWLVMVASVSTWIWGVPFGWERLTEVMNFTLFAVGDREITLKSIASLMVVLALTGVVNRIVAYIIRRHVFEYFTWDDGVRHAILSILKYVILFMGIVLGLELVGIGLSAMALFAGVIGIGIGFGLQNIASNFISGLIILFERPIKKGDFVEAGGLEGRVEQISARATSVVTRDNVSVIVPNSEFIGQSVVNLSRGTNTVRLHVPIGVAYGSDPEEVKAVLLKVADENLDVLDDPAPEVQFREFADSSLNFELLVWSTQYERKQAIISGLNFAIFRAFKQRGIQIPFPQMDVHVDPGEKA